MLATSRVAADRRAAFDAHYDVFGATRNTYAALYNGVLHRDWFQARARGYATTLDAALFGDAIPPEVVTTLIAETRTGVEPFRRYHRLRKRVLGLDQYTAADAYVPLVEHDVQYRYDDVRSWIVESTARLGAEYQARVREAFDRRWIDVYENQGKRSGAYSAPVYGAHPYMLLNYNDTLDAVFTLAHEMGHSMHTLLAHAAQPFVYAGYTIFVAEVPSTLNEELLLELMLERVASRDEGIVLLQHAIDGIVGTFYNQVLFADFELEAHRMVERDEPITAEALTTLYNGLLDAYWGDAIARDERLGWTWARIPHFYGSPYYVYQYATCMASTAALMQEVSSAEPDPPCRRGAPLSVAAGGRRQRPPDDAAQAGRGRPVAADGHPRARGAIGYAWSIGSRRRWPDRRQRGWLTWRRCPFGVAADDAIGGAIAHDRRPFALGPHPGGEGGRVGPHFDLVAVPGLGREAHDRRARIGVVRGRHPGPRLVAHRHRQRHRRGDRPRSLIGRHRDAVHALDDQRALRHGEPRRPGLARSPSSRRVPRARPPSVVVACLSSFRQPARSARSGSSRIARQAGASAAARTPPARGSAARR